MGRKRRILNEVGEYIGAAEKKSPQIIKTGRIMLELITNRVYLGHLIEKKSPQLAVIG